MLAAALGRFVLAGAIRNQPHAVPLGGVLDDSIQMIFLVRGEELLQWDSLLGGDVGCEWQTTQPVGIERFNDAEVFKDEVSHVPDHQIARKDILQQVQNSAFDLKRTNGSSNLDFLNGWQNRQ
jgi:hypothetical protein